MSLLFTNDDFYWNRECAFYVHRNLCHSHNSFEWNWCKFDEIVHLNSFESWFHVWNEIVCSARDSELFFSGNIQTSDGNAFVLRVCLFGFVHKLMLTIYLSWLCARELSIACLIDLFDTHIHTHTPFTERNSKEITCIFITSIESCEMRIDWDRRRW